MKDIIRLGLRIYTKLRKTCHLTITNLKGLIDCMVLIVFRLWSNCDRFAWFDLKAVNFCSVFFFSFKNVAWFNFFNDLLHNILGSAFLDDYQEVFSLPWGRKKHRPKIFSAKNSFQAKQSLHSECLVSSEDCQKYWYSVRKNLYNPFPRQAFFQFCIILYKYGTAFAEENKWA